MRGQGMLAVMPDSNRDSDSDGYSKNQCSYNPWPFTRAPGNTEAVFNSLLVVISLR